MKIGFTGIDLPEGKVKYQDEALQALIQKDNPKKISPYYAEFFRDEFSKVHAIVVPKDRILDLLILDMEKIESRQMRATEPAETALLSRCMERLEQEIPLCDVEFDEGERILMNTLAPASLKPVVRITGDEDVNTIISLALEQAGYMFFYTTGPSESHSWLVRKNSDIVTCAAAIHSDLARGFIKGDVVSFEDYLNCHNFNECKSKGLAKLVERDYVVQPREILEIRFNV